MTNKPETKVTYEVEHDADGCAWIYGAKDYYELATASEAWRHAKSIGLVNPRIIKVTTTTTRETIE